jgi:hypothetical protein
VQPAVDEAARLLAAVATSLTPVRMNAREMAQKHGHTWGVDAVDRVFRLVSGGAKPQDTAVVVTDVHTLDANVVHGLGAFQPIMDSGKERVHASNGKDALPIPGATLIFTAQSGSGWLSGGERKRRDIEAALARTAAQSTAVDPASQRLLTASAFMGRIRSLAFVDDAEMEALRAVQSTCSGTLKPSSASSSSTFVPLLAVAAVTAVVFAVRASSSVTPATPSPSAPEGADAEPEPRSDTVARAHGW